MKKVTNQLQAVEDHLLSGEPLTSFRAINRYGCTRLAARVHHLRSLGLDIKDKWLMTKDRYNNPVRVKQYWIE